RFPWPALVFNSHRQFEQLRADGRYRKMQGVIRERDRALQGDINPNLADFGDISEARQYSGRATEPGWQCPLRVRTLSWTCRPRSRRQRPRPLATNASRRAPGVPWNWPRATNWW